MKKISSKRRTTLKARVLRFWETNKGFEEPSSPQEKTVPGGIPGNNYQREIETARLEAERRKAKALMECQKRLFIL